MTTARTLTCRRRPCSRCRGRPRRRRRGASGRTPAGTRSGTPSPSRRADTRTRRIPAPGSGLRGRDEGSDGGTMCQKIFKEVRRFWKMLEVFIVGNQKKLERAKKGLDFSFSIAISDVDNFIIIIITITVIKTVSILLVLVNQIPKTTGVFEHYIFPAEVD